MQLVNKFSFEVKTDLRSYQFILCADSPIDEALNVLESVRQYYQNMKVEAEAKMKAEAEANQTIEKPIQA